ncbi:MAG: dihydroorotase [Candidatus Omnitrophica bacterium]|nr:dihydroorotase [Candidatus Omnitrophota bacterium]
MKLLIKHGRVIDPANNVDDKRDILIDQGTIVAVDKNIVSDKAEIIDAAGAVVIPGLVDMHVHLREPGREDKETVKTGTQAAAKGGVTSVLAMPNTSPCMDSWEHIELLKGICKETAQVNVFMSAAITHNRQGETLTDSNALKKAGVVAISDDGSSVDNDALMVEACEEARENNMLVICHSEDRSLSNHGVVNLGFMSTKLGLRGIAKESEYKRVERDIRIAEKTGCRMHIAHVSCKESVALIAAAKKKGLPVSAETAPHYFALDETKLASYDTNLKMNPPLRTAEDVKSIKEALKSGIIDVIASDHAPHTENEKDIEFERAEFGVVGLETELSVSLTELLDRGFIDWKQLVNLLCVRPAQILGIPKGTLRVGADADVAVVFPDEQWTVDKESLISKSKNSAFLGTTVKGRVGFTVCSGNVVYASPQHLRLRTSC